MDQERCQADIDRHQRVYDARKRNNTDESSVEYFTARWLVKTAVKQAKRNEDINVARLWKTKSKGFHSYINERRIIKDNVGPLKTPTGQIVNTNKYMANTLNTYFSSVFTHEQNSTAPQIFKATHLRHSTLDYRRCQGEIKPPQEMNCREWDVTGQDKVTGQDLFLSCPLYLFPHSFSSSYLLPLFHCLISILLFPCASVQENTCA